MKIYQVEISNYCNLSCGYCPYSIQKRKKGFMTFETFKKVVKLAKKCGQKEIYLHNFGEPLLHPKIYEFISYATNNNLECSFYTNGLLLNKENIKKLYEVGIKKISISDHVKDTHLKVEKLLRETNVPIKIEDIYIPIEVHNWAGQVKDDRCNHFSKKDNTPCIFQRKDAFVILWNGDIASCCLDCEGISVKQNIDDVLKKGYKFSPFKLCSNCDLMRGDEEL